MSGYLQAVWRCRYFWLALVRMDLRTRYRRSFLGMGWSLLHPIAMTAILCTMFHQVLGLPVKQYAPYVLAGLACWNYVLGTALQGCQCFYQGEAYIRQYPAPLAIYPLRTALGLAVHLVLALGVVLCFAWFCNGLGNAAALLGLLPAVALLLVLGWSLAVLGGFANVRFTDTQHIAEVGFQFMFYATPIIYTEDLLRGHQMAWLLSWNPFVPILRLVRDPILNGHVASAGTFAASAAIVATLAAAAGWTLARSQRTLIFHL